MATIIVSNPDVQMFLLSHSRPVRGRTRDVEGELREAGAVAVLVTGGDWAVVCRDGTEQAVEALLAQVQEKAAAARRLAWRWAELNRRLARLARRELVRIRHPEVLIELSGERNACHEALARLVAELEGVKTHETARLRALQWVAQEMGGPAVAAVYRIAPGDELRVVCDLPGVSANLEWYESDWHDPGNYYRALIVRWELGEYTWEEVTKNIRVVDRDGNQVDVTWMIGGPRA